MNGKILAYSAQNSPEILLKVLNQDISHVSLMFLSIKDGTILKDFNLLLHKNKELEVLDLFNEKLLVKQENENLQIIDVRNAKLIEVSITKFMAPSVLVLLYLHQLLLTIRSGTVSVWNTRGELVTSFVDHLLWHADCHPFTTDIAADQDSIISYCRADAEDQLTEDNARSINISNILTGKCLAKINVANGSSKIDEFCGSSNGCSCEQSTSQSISSTVTEALEDITALCYDEDRNEIYTAEQVYLSRD